LHVLDGRAFEMTVASTADQQTPVYIDIHRNMSCSGETCTSLLTDREKCISLMTDREKQACKGTDEAKMQSSLIAAAPTARAAHLLVRQIVEVVKMVPHKAFTGTGKEVSLSRKLSQQHISVNFVIVS
jgi:hypothetical protein